MLRFIFPRGKHKIGTGQNQAKKFINTDEKKIQHNPFPKLILSESLRLYAWLSADIIMADNTLANEWQGMIK